jgi:hypothetical protein
MPGITTMGIATHNIVTGGKGIKEVPRASYSRQVTYKSHPFFLFLLAPSGFHAIDCLHRPSVLRVCVGVCVCRIWWINGRRTKRSKIPTCLRGRPRKNTMLSVRTMNLDSPSHSRPRRRPRRMKPHPSRSSPFPLFLPLPQLLTYLPRHLNRRQRLRDFQLLLVLQWWRQRSPPLPRASRPLPLLLGSPNPVHSRQPHHRHPLPQAFQLPHLHPKPLHRQCTHLPCPHLGMRHFPERAHRPTSDHSRRSHHIHRHTVQRRLNGPSPVLAPCPRTCHVGGTVHPSWLPSMCVPRPWLVAVAPAPAPVAVTAQQLQHLCPRPRAVRYATTSMMRLTNAYNASNTCVAWRPVPIPKPRPRRPIRWCRWRPLPVNCATTPMMRLTSAWSVTSSCATHSAACMPSKRPRQITW